MWKTKERMTKESEVVDTCMVMRKEIQCERERRKCLFLPVVGTENRGM